MSTVKTVAAVVAGTIVIAYGAFAIVCAAAVVFPSIGEGSCVPEAEATVAEVYDGNICEE